MSICLRFLDLPFVKMRAAERVLEKKSSVYFQSMSVSFAESFVNLTKFEPSGFIR